MNIFLFDNGAGSAFLLCICSITGKYLIANNPFQEFGETIVNRLLDVAIVIPKQNFPLALNSVTGLLGELNFHFHWTNENVSCAFSHSNLETNSNKCIYELFLGRQVVKNGITSGLTTGTIRNCSRGGIFVQGDQVCRFAWPGDSGAPVFDVLTGILIGIIKCGIIKAGDELNEIVEVLPIWEFRPWLDKLFAR
jgi:hypothetical protein